MKKIIKFIMKALKVYIIGDVIVWCILGIGQFIGRCKNDNDDNPNNILYIMFDETCDNLKWLFDCFK